jgi:hypothetical protein
LPLDRGWVVSWFMIPSRPPPYPPPKRGREKGVEKKEKPPSEGDFPKAMCGLLIDPALRL